MLFEFGLVYEDGHRIDSGRHMLEGNTAVLEDTQNFSPKPNFGVHHRFLDGNRAETSLSGDTGDGVFRLPAGILDDECTRILRLVGVADVDRDALAAYREDGILMKDAGTHVSQFTQFFVGDGLDRNRIFHDARVGYQETGYIGPVLVEVCVNRAGYDGASDIRTTAGEGVDRAVRIGPVEARDNGALSVREAFGQLFIGFLGQECTILVKEDYLGCIDELIAQVMGHDDTV